MSEATISVQSVLTEDPYWNPLVPELTVKELAESLRFYLAAGFTVRFSRSEPPFAYLELGGAQLMLEQEHEDGWKIAPLHRPLGRGINFQIEVADATATCEALKAAGFPSFQALEESWYQLASEVYEGQLEFLVQDPDGYLLRFAEPLGRRSTTAQAPGA